MDYLVGHLVGDILFQNRWLARFKRENPFGLVFHLYITTFTICVFAGWWDWRGLAAFVVHGLIDGLNLGKGVWSRLVEQGDPDTDLPAPEWLRLLNDQILHVLSLYLIARFLG